MGHKLINDSELVPFGFGQSKNSKLKALHSEQKQNWPLLQKGARELSSIQKRIIELHNEPLIVQFNPARIASVAAKIDANSIKARPCFLCANNLPPEQQGIVVGKNTIALANPMPIFPYHFTLTHPEHHPQDISGKFEEFLIIARELSDDNLIFFNGALAGASAPDHYHLQSCPIDSFPLITSLRKNSLSKEKLLKIKSIEIETLKFCNNKYILLTSNSLADLNVMLEKVLGLIALHHKNGKEMVNILSFHEEGKGWSVVIIPREKHRPNCFFEEDPKKMLISPATVEMAGVIVTARESDFQKITSQDIEVIYNEVALNTTSFNKLIKSLIEIN